MSDSIFDMVFEENEKLKECPFCQGTSCLQYIVYHIPVRDIWYNPQCSECRAGWNENYETKDEAIAAWNERN